MSAKNDNSIVWAFFNKINQEKDVACSKCGKSYKFCNSTSGMIAHIRSAHSEELNDTIMSRASRKRSSSKPPSSYSAANDAFILLVKNFFSFCDEFISELSAHPMFFPICEKQMSLQEKKEDSSVSESDDDSEEECDSSADVSSLTS
ncbi:hypothetical protein CRE_30130 [Caenorhabditis remanei]|uniref:BED-type domain-containing protein n=1 Tax=Caenorhabditis remanei TaxID=31234 RepID=E3N632_CAERE|nr:hypothetical protein CRE_30130 [Caenorhabditis remanei]